MESVETLIVGAGVSGLSFANAIRTELGGSAELLVLEADQRPGGYCKTILQDGFVWDYSGHFFHFRRPEIEAWLRERMPGQEIRTVAKRSLIRFAGRDIDFPFQKNIHQLPHDDFIDCLHDLYFREDAGQVRSFSQMLYSKFGRGIAERFLVPYNEKLYACDLDTLDADAMGRFFPHADIADIIRNMRRSDNASYNSTFSYPAGGAIEYINALLHDLSDADIAYGEALVGVDVERKVATTTKREISFQRLLSSAPLDRFAAMTELEYDAGVFSSNKVLVFNLGFDRKGPEGVHWMYFPDRARSFYRVGWYDNIMATPRMSLYVEIGATTDAELDVETARARVLADLEAEGIVAGHELVSWHSVVLDPAYVHITQASKALVDDLRGRFAASGIYTVGRYGGWTYCSIEDNIIETRDLAKTIAS